MQPDNRRITGSGSGWSGLLGRVVATLVTAAAIVAGIMFSLVFLVVALVFGIALFCWMRWKFRRAIRQAQQDLRYGGMSGERDPAASADGKVIEGEVVRGEWKDDPRPRD